MKSSNNVSIITINASPLREHTFSIVATGRVEREYFAATCYFNRSTGRFSLPCISPEIPFDAIRGELEKEINAHLVAIENN